MKMLLARLLLLINFSTSSFCGHKPLPYHGPSSRNLKVSLSRSDSWDSMRMKVDWNHVTSSSKSKYKKYLEAGYSYFSNALKVHRITSINQWDDLYLTEYEECQDFLDYSGTKMNGTDYLLIIQEIDDSDTTAIAMAGACAYDPGTDQPIAGILIMNLEKMQDSTEEELVMIFTHELGHAFGFSSNSFENFRKSNGNKYSEDELFEVATIRGLKNQYFLKTPNVLKRARIAFNCPDLPGLQIENQGGSTSAGSHWESRVMRTELMNPQLVSKNAVYSDLTLAVFEDSGWYKPDYSYSSNINFGYKKGCGFHTKKCIVNEKEQFHEFCTDVLATLCSASHLEKGKCQIYDYDEELQKEFQYFSDPEIGGNGFTDFCPLVSMTRSCRVAYNANSEYGEKFCDNCRCVEGYFGLTSATDKLHSSCHEIDCVDGVVVITVGQQKVYCEQEDQLITVPGYKGKLKCPNYNTICVKPSCINNCFGKKCYNGVCEEDDSFSSKLIMPGVLIAFWIS